MTIVIPEWLPVALVLFVLVLWVQRRAARRRTPKLGATVRVVEDRQNPEGETLASVAAAATDQKVNTDVAGSRAHDAGIRARLRWWPLVLVLALYVTGPRPHAEGLFQFLLGPANHSDLALSLTTPRVRIFSLCWAGYCDAKLLGFGLCDERRGPYGCGYYEDR